MDPRFPILHQGWIVGCDARGFVAALYNPATYQKRTLPVSVESIGLGSGIHLGRAGLFSMEEELHAEVRIVELINAPPAGKGEHWVYTTEDSVFYKKGRQALEPLAI